MLRIIGISGLWSHSDPTHAWFNFSNAFERQFPGAEFSAEHERNCHLWELGRMRNFRDRLVEKYDDGTDTIIVGHSMGGIVACSVASRFKHSRICGIGTIFSPHTLLGGIFSCLLGSPRNTEISIVSFKGKFDRVVWGGTRHPQAITHILLPSNHWTDLVEHPGIAEEVAAVMKQSLFPHTCQA